RIPNSTLGLAVPGLSIGSLSGAGTVNLNGNALSVGGDNNSTVFSGTITNTSSGGSLTKVGTGILTLNGGTAIDYTNVTVVSGGTLQIGDGSVPVGTIKTSAITDNARLVLEDVTGQTLTYGGTISGTGSIVQVGSWTLSISGTNSYSGPMLIAPGATV